MLLAALALASAWTIPLSTVRTWGWDESMHVELPAARLLLALRAGAVREAFDVLVDCAQYPFVYPVVLALAQSVTGISETACRATGTVLWCTALVGLYALAREIAARLPSLAQDGEAWRRLFPWLVMLFAGASPLCLAYSGTLFLEIPFASAAVFALRAWIRRHVEPPARGRELAAGAWLAGCIFTKFNYGLLFAAALAADWMCDAVRAARGPHLRSLLARSAWLFAIPVATVAWWFVWPWPAGVEMGAEHRAAVAEFLRGNRGGPRVPSAQRALHLAGYLTWTPRLLLLELVGLCCALSLSMHAAVRCIGITLVALAVPLWLHPFYLDRFWIPAAVPFWILAGLGTARWVTRVAKQPLFLLAALAAITCIPMGGRDTLWLARALGQFSSDPQIREYQATIYAGWSDLSGARPLPTAGLSRDEFQRMFEPIAREVGPEERVGWMGLASEVSPAAVALELLRRNGSPARFRRDAHRPMDVTYFSADPQWDDAELARFAHGFDVILYTDPIDLKDRPGRRFMRDYVSRLTGPLGWSARSIGSFEVSRPLGEPRTVTLWACRTTK